MPDICFNCEQKKTYLQFLRHLIFQFGIVCLCFLTASHKVSGLILLDDGSSYSFMSIMIFFFAKSFKMHSAVGMQQNRQAYIHTTQYIQQNCFLAAALLCPAARRALQLLQPLRSGDDGGGSVSLPLRVRYVYLCLGCQVYSSP